MAAATMVTSVTGATVLPEARVTFTKNDVAVFASLPGTQTKGGTSYVGRRREQADRAEHLRSAQHPRPEYLVSASSGGLHRRASWCVGPTEEDHGHRLQPALRDGLPRHPLRGA